MNVPLMARVCDSRVLAAIMLVASGPACADLLVDNGYLPTATVKGSVVYRALNSTGNTRVVVDNADIVCNTSCSPLTGASNSSINYGTGSGTRTITFEYDAATKTLKSTYKRGTGTAVTTSETYSTDLGALNYLAFQVRNSGAVVSISNIVVYKNGTPLTPNPAISTLGVTQSITQKYAIGEDLTGNFKVTADLNIAGSPGGGDSAYVLIKVGYSEPPDDQAPIVSNVHNTPLTPLLNATTDVEANVDDTTRGGSNIASADYTLDGSQPLVMYASDNSFDEVAEDVEVMTDALSTVGVHTACVRGTDIAGNRSGLDASANDNNDPCIDFLVIYAFSGFFQPIDNAALNVSQAGRAVPFKWLLTDAFGVPIDDPSSFVALKSYPIDCNDLTGNILDSVEEYSAGASGLQYNGDGYWQFNWKTPKTYAGTCMAAYIEFNSGQISPVVNFQFKK